MRRFPRLMVQFTLDKGIMCHLDCGTVVPPFSICFVLAKSVEEPNVGKLLCEACMKKEVAMRANIFREDLKVIATG